MFTKRIRPVVAVPIGHKIRFEKICLVLPYFYESFIIDQFDYTLERFAAPYPQVFSLDH